MHPSAGAVAVGARQFLIAYNINLESPDKDLAVRIARRIRESGGGLPRVQANGFFIDELGRAQVSMNILDFRTTPLWRVWETVRAEAAEDAIELAESELIGLAPLAAFLDVADHADAPPDATTEERLAAAARFLRLRDFSPLQALELRLEAARAGRRGLTAARHRDPPRHLRAAGATRRLRGCWSSAHPRWSRWPAACGPDRRRPRSPA